MNELYKKAAEFAQKKHEGQKRKHSDMPYIIHPQRVVELLKHYTDDPLILAAAILHDTIEDTETTYTEIETQFGAKVADLVVELTSDKEEKNKVGKSEYLTEKINSISPDARLIKLLDRYDNVAGLEQSPAEFARYYAKQTEYIINHYKGEFSDPEKIIVEQIRIAINPFL